MFFVLLSYFNYEILIVVVSSWVIKKPEKSGFFIKLMENRFYIIPGIPPGIPPPIAAGAA